MITSNRNMNYSTLDSMKETPSSIVWTQTMETITLHIDIKHVRVSVCEKYLKLSTQSDTVTLPLFHRVHVVQYDVEPTSLANKMILTLEKESFDAWPHLLKQQTDKEMEAQLLESNFLLEILYKETTVAIYDTLDFDSVINGQGEKTGLE